MNDFAAGHPNILDAFRLDGQLALVTGCRRGIGLAISRAFAEAGANVIGVSRTLEAGDSAPRHAVESAGGRFYPYACDLSRKEEVERLLETVGRDHPAPDILLNNAGVIRREPAAQHRDEYWDEVIATNLHSPWLLARSAGARMIERRSGKIIFIASLLAFQGGITVPSYSASKGAIAQLAKALANEWAPFNVQVNAIAPGYIETDNTIALREDPVRNPAILARIPAGRWGAPADLAGAAVFLASSASNYVTGTILTVDGGWMGR
jgi:2-deoxy-D-gluconate 3-dehydrogenase